MVLFAKKTIAVILLAVTCFIVQAQKKELTDEQYFKGDFKGIVQPLPVTGKWIDDSHVIFNKSRKRLCAGL
jgi:hypothetical protein